MSCTGRCNYYKKDRKREQMGLNSEVADNPLIAKIVRDRTAEKPVTDTTLLLQENEKSNFDCIVLHNSERMVDGRQDDDLMGKEIFSRRMKIAEAYERRLYRIPIMLIGDSIDRKELCNGNKRYFRIKRIVDVFFSTILLTLLTPIMIVTAIAIKLDSPGPIFYQQKRVGLEKATFSLIKFRSMIQDAEKDTGAIWASENDMRITRIGRIIRALRIDELPQLLNVLKGEMSLVGPRPERPEFVNNFLGDRSGNKLRIPLYSERLAVKPGITGWAQIMYPYAKTHEQSIKKLEYDLYYIKNISFRLDILIMIKTVRVALLGWNGKKDKMLRAS